MREATMRWVRGILFAAGIFHLQQAGAADQTLYAIGNSLTASMLPFSIPELATQRGRTFSVGFYTPSGRALDYSVANPALPGFGNPVTLDLAFQGYTWTSISMQPYPSATSTLASDIASIEAIVAAAKAGTSGTARLFIYSAWPSQASFAASGFANWWRSSVPDEPAQPTVLKRAYADHLHARLVARFGATSSVHVIPVGDVLAALDELIRAGQVAGLADIRQLYGDNDHVGDVGKFIAALTVYATVFKENPEGLAIPAGYFQGSAPAQLTPQLAAQLESLVWRVVNSDARAGVNSPPVAAPQSLSAPNSAALPITLGASDAEGSALAYAVVSVPLHGQLSGQPPLVTYTPDAGYRGNDSFSFQVNDGGLDSAPATVSIAVQTPPDPVQSSGGGGLGMWSLAGLAGLLARTWLRRRPRCVPALHLHRKLRAIHHA
jgi:hypothetical protein